MMAILPNWETREKQSMVIYLLCDHSGERIPLVSLERIPLYSLAEGMTFSRCQAVSF